MRSLIPVIPVTLEIDPPKEVGILPFVEMPEIIVWQNRVFLPTEPDSPNYTESTFAVARTEAEPNDLLIRLHVRTGQFVANAMILACDPFPGVVRWGDRIFRWTDGNIYTEAFFTIAQELEPQTEQTN